METNKLLSMIGLSKKAGKLLQGYEVVMESAMAGKVALILKANDLSPRSVRNTDQFAERSETPLVEIPVSMDELGERTGKRSGILGVTDTSFADAIKKILATLDEGGTIY